MKFEKYTKRTRNVQAQDKDFFLRGLKRGIRPDRLSDVPSAETCQV